MKTQKIELNVDFIGGQGSLTTEEEKAISSFLKARKLTPTKQINSKKFRSIKRPKTMA